MKKSKLFSKDSANFTKENAWEVCLHTIVKIIPAVLVPFQMATLFKVVGLNEGVDADSAFDVLTLDILEVVEPPGKVVDSKTVPGGVAVIAVVIISVDVETKEDFAVERVTVVD